ncbi:MAG: hypothetical protein J6C88_07805 [Lachnospiraceae bacterium]|nr:hypothetical protein [Lachnospiraceae bacterium]
MKISMLVKRLFLISVVISVLVFNLSTGIFLADSMISTEDRFGSDYSIAHILGNYSYFVNGNMSGNAVAHTSGAIIVGGELDFTASGFGNIMVAPSYINHIKGLGYMNAPFPGTEYLQEKRVVYYGTVDTSVPGYLFYNEGENNTKDNVLFCNPDYINVGTAMQAVRTESAAMAASGNRDAYIYEAGEVKIDFKKATSVTVSESLAQIQKITLENITIDELMKASYIVSFTGSGAGNINAQMIWLNGKTLDQQFKEYAIAHSEGSASTGGQYFLQGMNLIWNYPNVSELTYCNLNGHLIAPDAHVSVVGGRHEGGVIAASLHTESEAHFYPYHPKEPGTTTESGGTTTTESGGTTTTESSGTTTTESGGTTTTESGGTTTTEDRGTTTTEKGGTTTTEDRGTTTTEKGGTTTTEDGGMTTTEDRDTTTTTESGGITATEKEKASTTATQKAPVSVKAVQTGDNRVPVTAGIAAGISILILILDVRLKNHGKQS